MFTFFLFVLYSPHRAPYLANVLGTPFFFLSSWQVLKLVLPFFFLPVLPFHFHFHFHFLVSKQPPPNPILDLSTYLPACLLAIPE